MTYYTFMPRLLNMTLTASVVICVVLVLRLFLKKAPKAISYALWFLVLFRLLCPISFQSSFSAFSLMNVPTASQGENSSVMEYIPENIVHTEYPAVTLPIPALSEIINETLPQGEEQTVADPLEAPLYIATFTWIFGVAAMLVYSLCSYLGLRRKLQIVVPLRDNIFTADDIGSPFVVGLLRPRIYLPCNLKEKEQEYIILHEQFHIKRLDHIFKAVAFLALTVHWFNPLVWLAFILASKDMEMSCDEAVIGKMGSDIRADYSASLLALATGRRIIAGTPLAFGEGDTADRIKNLSKWKKPAIWIIAVAVVACIVVGVCFLTNPQSNSYRMCICIPGNSEFAYFYSNEEVTSKNGNLLIINTTESDTKVALLPADAQNDAILLESRTIKKGKNVSLPAVKGTWYQVGVYANNPSPVSKNVYITVKNAETQLNGFPINWSVLEGILWTPGENWEYRNTDSTIAASLKVQNDSSVVGTITKNDEISNFCLMYRVRGTKIFGDFYNCTPEVAQSADGENHLLFTGSIKVQKGDLTITIKDKNGIDYFGTEQITFVHGSLLPTGYGTVQRWFDCLNGDEMKVDGIREINLDEYPGVTFRWHSEKLEAVTDKETITLYTGMPIWSVYFCDLNGDGKREICSSVSFGSGMIDNRIVVADYANKGVYELSDRGDFDYYLTYRDGQLWVEKRASMQDTVLESGLLMLRSVVGTDGTATPMLMFGQSELQNKTNADIVQGMEVGDIVYVGDIAIQKAPDDDDDPSGPVTRSTTEGFEVKSFGGNTSVDKVLNLNSTYRYFYIYINNTGSNTISVTIGNNSSTQSNNFHEIPTGNYYIWSTNQWAAQSHNVSFSSINGMCGSAKAMLCSTLAEAENHKN